MSHLPDPLGQLSFYLTRPAPCPYINGQVEQKIFTRLSGDKRADFFLNSSMNQHGFRRSQTMVYRPACPTCMACVPVRIDLKNYQPDKRLRRIEKRNADLSVRKIMVNECAELYPMFSAYQQQRHADGDMAFMSEDEFISMMQDGGSNAYMLLLENAEGKTLAAMLVDELHHGTSAVYSFYDVNEEKRSLGTALIVHLIDDTARRGLDYVYLGYYIRDCRKMAYKAGFPALQRLGTNGWEVFK